MLREPLSIAVSLDQPIGTTDACVAAVGPAVAECSGTTNPFTRLVEVSQGCLGGMQETHIEQVLIETGQWAQGIGLRMGVTEGSVRKQ